MENNTKIQQNEKQYITLPKGIDNDEVIILKDYGHVLNELKSLRQGVSGHFWADCG